jgi:hypothetical protein
MTMLSKQKLRGAGLACWLLAAWPACAQVVLTNVAVVNVTPAGFSVVASVSPALASTSNVAVSVFADPGGATSLAGQVGVEYYPLNSGDPTATNAYGTLLSLAALRQDSMNLGLIYARVSSCAPGTTYYYQITVTETNGPSAVWPPGGPLPSATTAQENSFVMQSQQLLVTLNDASPPGSILTLSTSNSASVLAAVVGDGAGANQAFFNLNDLIAASGGTNYAPLGAQVFSASVLGAASPGLTQTYDLIFSNTFAVGQAGDVTLGTLSPTIALGTGVMLAGGSGSVPITLDAQSALVGLAFNVVIPTNLFTSISLQATSPALNAVSLTPLQPDLLRLSFTAASGENLLGSQQIALLNLTAASNQPTALLPLALRKPLGTNADASVSNLFTLQAGSAIILGPQPLLQMQLVAGSRNLVLYGIPGQSYQIQESANLAQAGGWTNYLLVPMTNLTQVFANLDPAPATLFFRAYVLNADPPLLQGALSGGNFTLLAYGLSGTNYTLQSSSNLSGTVAWNPLLSYTLTNTFQLFTNLGSTSPAFYRIKKQ